MVCSAFDGLKVWERYHHRVSGPGEDGSDLQRQEVANSRFSPNWYKLREGKKFRLGQRDRGQKTLTRTQWYR